MKGKTSLFQRTRALLLTLCMALMLLPVSAMADDEKTVVEDIRIDNVSTYLQEGQAFPFTGVSAEPDKYQLLGEYWCILGETDNGIDVIAYATNDPEDVYQMGEPLTTVERDVEYYHFARVRLTDGSCIFDETTTLTVNGLYTVPAFCDNGSTEAMGCAFITFGDYVPTTVLRTAGVVGATLDFKAGDKVTFTGKSAEPELYTITEYWSIYDEDGFLIEMCTSDPDYTDDFTEFQAGVTYAYNVEYQLTDQAIAQGYGFDRDAVSSINGRTVPGYFIFSDFLIGYELNVTFTADGASYQWPDGSDQPTNPEQPGQPTTPEQPSKPESPKTGDAGVMLWMTTAMAAAAAMVLTLRKKRA